MVFLSLGAGVQSSVMLMLAIRGVIERPDHVIFADTGFEPKRVYAHANWCERECIKAGIPFHIVSNNLNIRAQFDAFESGKIKHFDARPPLYVATGKGLGAGVLRRQCTRSAKVRPIQRKQIQLMGHKTARTCSEGEAITQIGISTDEARRASPSQNIWEERSYPLIDPLKYSRSDCQAWWDKNYPELALPSSACVICPYLTDEARVEMKQNAPDDWAVAIEYDERFTRAYRDKTGQSVYIHRQLMPLATVSLNENQASFDLEDELFCAGGCGL